MPRSKAIHHYPKQYGDIIEGCAIRAEKLTIPATSRMEAMKLRGHFYAYVGALRRTSREILDKARARALTEGEEEIIERAKQSEMVLVMIDEDQAGVRVAFCNREESWQAKMLARGVLTAGDAPAQPIGAVAAEKEEGMLARLMKIQAEVDGKQGGGQDGNS